MATSSDDWCDLTYLYFDVVGGKRYVTQCITLPFFHRLYLEREPSNLYDSNAVPVTAMYGGRHVVFGHMAKEAARYMILDMF